MWLSTDPAMGEYVPVAPIDDEAKKSNQNLPGMGGVFNYVNLHTYHYAGNNPVKYVDPNGMQSEYNQLIEGYLSGEYDWVSPAETWNALANDAERTADKVIRNAPHVLPGMIKSGVVNSILFMNKHGSKIALACYGSGLVQLGFVIDGVTIVCDVTVAMMNFSETGDIGTLVNDLVTIAAAVAVTHGTGHILETAGGMAEMQDLLGIINTVEGKAFTELLKSTKRTETRNNPNIPSSVGPGPNAVYSPDTLRRIQNDTN
jgi:hypothetical protein